MTEERKPETPGLAEVSPKFVDEALGRGAVPAVEDPVLALKREWEARYRLLDEQRDTGDAI